MTVKTTHQERAYYIILSILQKNYNPWKNLLLNSLKN